MKKAIIIFLANLIYISFALGQAQLEVESEGLSETVKIISNSITQNKTFQIERTTQLDSSADLIELKVPFPTGFLGQFIEAQHSNGGVVYRLNTDGSSSMVGTLTIGQINPSSDEVTINDIGSDGDAIISLNASNHEMIFGANATDEGILGTNTDSRLAFRTNNINRAIITKTGEFGVGTPGPKANLHIREDGISGQQTIVGILESVTSKRPLLLFSEGGSSLSNGMSIEYDGTSTGANNNLRINTTTGDVGLMVKNGGTVGIKGEASTQSILRVNQASGIPRAIEIVNSAGGNFWGITHNSNLTLDYNGSVRGTFNDVNGTYTSVSDRRLKSNISTLSDNTLEKVMALNPVSYTFKDQEGDKKSIGFIAQDIEALYPELIHLTESQGQDLLTLSYAEFGVIAIKAIQEQQAQIEMLQSELSQVEDLKKDLLNLKAQFTASINKTAAN